MFRTARLLNSLTSTSQPIKIHSAQSLVQVNRSKRISHLLVFHSTNHCYHLHSDRIRIDGVVQPIHVWADRSRWYKRTDSLWWSVICKKDAALMRRTVRSYTARRVRNAVTESLKKQGYNPDGSRLVEDGVPNLFGTLQVMPRSKALTAKYVEILKETDLVVKLISSPGSAKKLQEILERKTAKFESGKTKSNTRSVPIVSSL
ncbi:hypothetical protein GLAREA_02579 [Glarea lozoyensis ATCC 20868]|uniref:Uncharacterized protein n=1 Tax=Glarea lozoyensis (strain ATCC 20868 / MF5171) TaxID=1116229 RepID=S3D3M6_GLAL2|nr:uncharacterized protein GLAREA_02579 [Glarea lozoyensis ATCC 20868]EPE26666.1 hypothetical protein GLAREA_02579 [Glarea lozoyensis ATCC 20868]